MRFLVDAQLPPVLARYLTDLGYQAKHVFELGMTSASDVEVAKYAVEHAAIIITKDEDFVAMRAFQADAPAVIWVRIGNTTSRELTTRLSHSWPAIIAALESGESLVEVV